MFDDPNVVAAIVAASVSLIVSGASGFYTIFKNRKRFEDLRNELLVKDSVDTFVVGRKKYLESYRMFERNMTIVLEENPDDGTKAVQLAVDFYGETARDFYLTNKSFLKSKELNRLFDEIYSIINSGTLNHPENDSGKGEFGRKIFEFCRKLHEKNLESLA